MSLTNSIKRSSVTRRGKGVIRVLLLLSAAAVVAGIAAAFGIARDYGYLRASILTGSADGQYHALATRLAHRAKEEHGAVREEVVEAEVEAAMDGETAKPAVEVIEAPVEDSRTGDEVPAEAGCISGVAISGGNNSRCSAFGLIRRPSAWIASTNSSTSLNR